MVIQLQLELENQNLNSVFRPGDYVSGHIILLNTSTRSVKLEGLELDIIGEEYVYWEHKPGLVLDLVHAFLRKSLLHNPTKTYEDGAFFINKTLPILGKYAINPGAQRCLKFQFLIPDESPSTYKSDRFNGQVSYKICAKLIPSDRGGILCDNIEAEQLLSVIGVLDLNAHHVFSPIKIKKKSKRGEKGFKLSLSKQGFVPGESLSFRVKMYLDNLEPGPNRRRFYKAPTIRLVRTEYLVSPSIGKKSRLHETTIVQKSLPLVPKWEDELHIPSNLDLTNLAGSKYIRISYYLKIKAFGLRKLPVIPIVIGTIPVILDNNNEYPIMNSSDEMLKIHRLEN